jgi:hypothetical protein
MNEGGMGRILNVGKGIERGGQGKSQRAGDHAVYNFAIAVCVLFDVVPDEYISHPMPSLLETIFTNFPFLEGKAVWKFFQEGGRAKIDRSGNLGESFFFGWVIQYQ